MNDVDELKSKLDHARDMLTRANAAMDRANAKEQAAHEMGGGIPGFGGSGSQRAARQVRSAFESSQRAWREATERIEHWTYKVKRLELRLAEAERVRLTAADLKGATLVKDAHSWHKVVRVSAKSVTVETPYSWTDRIAIEQVRDFR